DSDDDYDHPTSPKHAAAETAHPPSTQLAHTGNAYHIARPTEAPASITSSKRYDFLRPMQRAMSTPTGGGSARRPFMARVFSIAPSPRPATADVALEAYREVDFRQAEFFLFLDKELLKIEKFYRKIEDEAVDRLK
ncbi:Xenotropic and polytropic retrovirus receptor 1, partial [Teratosphaeriaceae sp. CCFEE 6253]